LLYVADECCGRVSQSVVAESSGTRPAPSPALRRSGDDYWPCYYTALTEWCRAGRPDRRLSAGRAAVDREQRASSPVSIHLIAAGPARRRSRGTGRRLDNPSCADPMTHRRYSIRPASRLLPVATARRPSRPRSGPWGWPLASTPHGAAGAGPPPHRDQTPLSPGGRTQSTKQFSCGAECITCRARAPNGRGAFFARARPN